MECKDWRAGDEERGRKIVQYTVLMLCAAHARIKQTLIDIRRINQLIGGTTWFRFLNNCADQGRSLQGVTGDYAELQGQWAKVYKLCGSGLADHWTILAAKWQLQNGKQATGEQSLVGKVSHPCVHLVLLWSYNGIRPCFRENKWSFGRCTCYRRDSWKHNWED